MKMIMIFNKIIIITELLELKLMKLVLFQFILKFKIINKFEINLKIIGNKK